MLRCLGPQRTAFGVMGYLPRASPRIPPVSGKLFPGAGEGIRTPDPLITNQMLYRLSYASIRKHASSDTILPYSLSQFRDNYRKYHIG